MTKRREKVLGQIVVTVTMKSTYDITETSHGFSTFDEVLADFKKNAPDFAIEWLVSDDDAEIQIDVEGDKAL